MEKLKEKIIYLNSPQKETQSFAWVFLWAKSDLEISWFDMSFLVFPSVQRHNIIKKKNTQFIQQKQLKSLLAFFVP